MAIIVLLLLAAISYGNYRLCIFSYAFYKRTRQSSQFNEMNVLWHKTMRITLPIAIFGTGLNAICTVIVFLWAFSKLLMQNLG